MILIWLLKKKIKIFRYISRPNENLNIYMHDWYIRSPPFVVNHDMYGEDGTQSVRGNSLLQVVHCYKYITSPSNAQQWLVTLYKTCQPENQFHLVARTIHFWVSCNHIRSLTGLSFFHFIILIFWNFTPTF